YAYGIRGDYNRDGRVDAADYTVWRNALNETPTSGTGADGDVNGMVNFADYHLWREHYGDVALAGFGEQPSFIVGNAVAEPTSGMIAAIGALLYCGTARRP